MKNPIAALIAGLCLTLHVATAQAQDTPREQAAALAEQATAAFEEERLDDAIAAYTQAFDLVPDPSFAYNLGGLHMMNENQGQALRYFEAYLRLFPGASDRAEVEDLIDELRTELTSTWTQVSVESTPLGATVIAVYTDGTSEGLGTTPLQAFVRPGETRLSVQLEGYEDDSDLFNGIPGILVPLTFTLTEIPVIAPIETTPVVEPELPPANPNVAEQPPESGPNVAGWSLVGAGAVSAGVGVAFLLTGQATEQDYNTLVGTIGPGVDVSQTELDNLESKARTQTTVGIALTGVGIGALATGTYFLIRGDRSEPASSGVTSFSIMPTRRGAAVSLGGRF
jgi:tetratricopeptide (TPR) repeat protein